MPKQAEAEAEVMNPHQLSLAKQCNYKSWKMMPRKYRNKMKPKGMVLFKPIQLQIQQILTRKIWCSQNATNQPFNNSFIVFLSS